MMRRKPISFAICGCPVLTAVVSAITGSLLLPGISLYINTSQANFVAKLIIEMNVAEEWMTFP